MLYICATPIGNLEDITLRVLRILREVDLIVAEDTRRTRKLLSHYQISNHLVSFHKHNEHTKSDYLLSLLEEGKTLALVSDAGMPGISDPGAELITKVIQNKFPLTVLPGATASVTAVVQSGLLTGPFYFQGFLPQKTQQAKDVLARLATFDCPLVFYEAPHRLVVSLTVLKDFLGDRACAISRELTKVFEETLRGRLSEMIAYFEENRPRGEFVITVQGDPNPRDDEDIPISVDVRQELILMIEAGISKKEAIKIVARRLGVSRNTIYQQALDLPIGKNK